MNTLQRSDLDFAAEKDAGDSGAYDRSSGTRWNVGPPAGFRAEERIPESSRGGSGLHELTESGAMRDVLRCCKRLKPEAELRTADDRVFRVRLLGLMGEHEGVELAVEGPPPEGSCSVRFSLHQVVFLLEGRLRLRDEQASLWGPLRLYSLDRRAITRAPLREGRAELVWTSLDAEELLPGRCAVRDLTPSGAGVVVEDAGPPLPSSAFPAALRVGKRSIPCIAEVRGKPDPNSHSAGVRLRPAGLTSGLIETYLMERIPQLVPRASVETDALRALMNDSGYLKLRASVTRFEAWHRGVPEDSSNCDRVYVARDGSLLGHASATRIHRKTWLLHQLACLGGHAESGLCRHALYLLVATVPVLYDGSGSSIVVYFNQELRWHKLFCQEFTEWTADPALAHIATLDRFERDEPPQTAAAPANCEVRAIRDDELVAACALARAHLPQIAADAFDVHPGELRRPTTQAGQRGREVLVLREHGVMVGVALCELGDPNASLFNILNMAHVFVRTGRYAPSPSAQRALISSVRMAYAARGIERPLLVSPTGTLDATVEPGTRLAEGMGCMVVTGRGLRQWENFCSFHIAMRWQRNGPGATTARGDEA